MDRFSPTSTSHMIGSMRVVWDDKQPVAIFLDLLVAHMDILSIIKSKILVLNK